MRQPKGTKNQACQTRLSNSGIQTVLFFLVAPGEHPMAGLTKTAARNHSGAKHTHLHGAVPSARYEGSRQVAFLWFFLLRFRFRNVPRKKNHRRRGGRQDRTACPILAWSETGGGIGRKHAFRAQGRRPVREQCHDSGKTDSEDQMPIYEYVCGKCQAGFELLVRNATEQPACPECKSAKVERRLSVVAAPSTRGGQPEFVPGTCGRQACSEGGCQGRAF